MSGLITVSHGRTNGFGRSRLLLSHNSVFKETFFVRRSVKSMRVPMSAYGWSMGL